MSNRWYFSALKSVVYKTELFMSLLCFRTLSLLFYTLSLHVCFTADNKVSAVLNIISLHHTHFLPITVCHLSPPPLPLHSLLRLVGSSLYKLLFTLSKPHPPSPSVTLSSSPSSLFKASSLVLHLLFLLESHTYLINTHTTPRNITL